jgi:hypothetical protein
MRTAASGVSAWAMEPRRAASRFRRSDPFAHHNIQTNKREIFSDGFLTIILG